MDESTTAASQPAETQSSDGKGKNITVAGIAAMLLAKEPKAPETEAASTEELPADSTEPQDQKPETKDEGAEAAEAEVTPEVPAEEAEADEDTEVLSQDEKPSPKQQAAINKRIGKEVAKRKALEEEIRKIQLEREEERRKVPEVPKTQEPVTLSTPDNPLGDVSDLVALQAKHKEAMDIRDWAKEALDREDIDNGVEANGQRYSKRDLKEILRNADKVVERHIPERARYIQTRQHIENQAKATFDWYVNKNTPEYQQLQATYREQPFLKQDPRMDYFIGLAIEGQKALAAKKQAQAAPAKSAPKAPGSQTAVSSGATARGRNTEDAAKKQQVLAEVATIKSRGNLSVNDVTALLAKRTQLKSR